jgi:hypothetical protein
MDNTSAAKRVHRSWAIAAGVLLIDAALSCASAQITFQDVSAAAGFANTGTETWGASWGDLDGDHYPDLFSSNHRQRATLYHNNQNGTFTDVSKQVDLSKTPGWTGGRSDVDTHGATWADINNDGQEDLIEAVSSSDDHVWINNGGKLTLVTSQVGITGLPNKSHRQTVVFDYNGDGLLDYASIGLHNSTLYPQLANGTFNKSMQGQGAATPLACASDGQWAALSDIDPASPGLELVCAPRITTWPKVNAYANGQLSDVTALYTQYANVNDGAEFDFNGDLQPDYFLVRNSERPSDAYQWSPTAFEAQMITAANKTKGVTFQSTGILTLIVSTRAGQAYGNLDPLLNGDPNNIKVGSSQWSPASLTFNLDPTDPNNAGIATGALGMNIGFLPGQNGAPGQWKISQGNNVYSYSYIQVSSTQPITNLAFFGASGTDKGMAPIVLQNTPGGLVSVKGIGLDSPENCVSVVTGDFDNDMHEDVYVACTGGSQNLPNRLFHNNGNGTFTEIANAGGAAGLVGAAIAQGAGTSDSVVVADYDLDGQLDLLVTNGLNMRPLFQGGPKQLFHNTTNNGNNWMEFDLVGNGTTDNRDGIGSKVYVKSPDGVTQYREQSGGYHRWSQNFMRVHVGMAANTQADVTVVWPNNPNPVTYLALPVDHVWQLNEDGTYAQIK